MLKMIVVNPPVLQTILVLRGRDTVKLMQIVRYSVLQTILVLRGRDTVMLIQIVRYSVLHSCAEGEGHCDVDADCQV